MTEIYFNLNTNLSLISCRGPEARTFLQGQITHNIDDCNDKKAIFSGYCDHKGRIIASFYLFQKEDCYFLLLPKNMGEKTFLELKKFAIFSKVTLTLEENYYIFGSFFEKPLQKDHIELPGNIPRFILLKTKSQLRKKEIEIDINVDVNKEEDENGNKTHLITANETTNIPLATIIDLQKWQNIEFNSRIVMITPEISGIFLPHQLGYELIPAVHFKKGCYRGQEIIARMHYLGKLKQHLYVGKLDAPTCNIGTIIINEKNHEVGQIAAYIPSEDPHCYHVLISLMDEASSSTLRLKNDPEHSMLIVC